MIAVCDIILELMSKDQSTASESLIIEHLWSSALIKYFRCFAPGKRKSFLSQLKDVFSSITSGDAISLHEYFLHVRNKHIAHSVNNQEVLKVGISIDPITLKILGFSPIVVRRIHEHIDITRDFQVLAKNALQYAQNLSSEIEAQALALAEAEGVEKLMKRPKLQFTVNPSSESASTVRKR